MTPSTVRRHFRVDLQLDAKVQIPQSVAQEMEKAADPTAYLRVTAELAWRWPMRRALFHALPPKTWSTSAVEDADPAPACGPPT
ncbi:hypothetical protein [Streptomyces bobili]|uniref:hypothetical protein n=1 Tax=Streptomyces bobili TaxID=67280 RepID=UPI0037FB75E3